MTYTAAMNGIIEILKQKSINHPETPSLNWISSASKPFLGLLISPRSDTRLRGIIDYLSDLQQPHQIKESLDKRMFASVAGNLRKIEEVAARINARMAQDPELTENLVQRFNNFVTHSKNNQDSANVLSALLELITEHIKHHDAIINALANVLDNKRMFDGYLELTFVNPKQQLDIGNPLSIALQMKVSTEILLIQLNKADEGFQKYNEKRDSFVNSLV